MPGILHHATLAEVSAQSLPALAAMRATPGLRVLLAGSRAWVRWDTADFAIVQALLPAAETRFFERRDGQWFACGSCLPAGDMPAGEFVPLATMLLPGRMEVQASMGHALTPVTFAIVRDNRPRDCSAIVCTQGALAHWAAMAPDAEIARYHACRSGELVLLVGSSPPMLPGCERFWGSRLLLPLGWRANLELPEAALCEAAGASAQELVLWRGGAVVVSRGSMAPLSRACARWGARLGT